MKTQGLLELLAVVLATAITAFLVVACWSLLGGPITYIITMLLGGTTLCVWSDDNEHPHV